MKKYRSYIFLLILIFSFLIFGYIYLGNSSKHVDIIELKFISDHSLVTDIDSPIPDDIIAFSDCYTKNDSVDYISRISFKRTDIGNLNADSLNNYEFRIGKGVSINETKKMFKKENASKKATEKMYLESIGTSDNIELDTTNIRYFYLVPMNDPRAQGSSMYFDQHQKLKDYINDELKQGKLFKGKEKNIITIILTIGQNNEMQKADIKKDKVNNLVKNEIDKTSTENNNSSTTTVKKNISIKALLKKISKNKVQWSDDLKNYAESITIVFDNGMKKYTENVTNMNSYIFNSGDKDFDGVEVTVTLIVGLPNNIKVNDALSMKMKVVCSL